jgi:hypothetical protein
VRFSTRHHFWRRNIPFSNIPEHPDGIPEHPDFKNFGRITAGCGRVDRSIKLYG